MNASTMDVPLFLTADEIATLTGFKAPKKQVGWLGGKGWRFEINGNRKPIVARKYAEKMLGCAVADEAPYKPNFAALRGT